MTQSQAENMRQDTAFVVDVLTRYQRESAHGEMVVRIQDGRVMMVEESRKHKPEKGRA